MRLSVTEENYLKAIYQLNEQAEQESYASTNAIAHQMNIAAASVTVMLKQLAKKKLVEYQPYKGGRLSDIGSAHAIQLIRKHRLWEVFLLQKLHFKWDEVHDIAEQLEHIQSNELTNRLDVFLGHPKFDPHGDPIPDSEGKLPLQDSLSLMELPKNVSAEVVGVNEHTPALLHYLDQIKINIGVGLKVLRQFDYDGSLEVSISDNAPIMLSEKVCKEIIVKLQ